MNTDLQQELEITLARYVAMPTVTADVANCRAAIDQLAKELANFGLHVHKDGNKHPWLIATTRQTKHPKILLGAHFDVVAPNSDGHFKMQETGGKLYGRGVFDMKFAVACYKQLLEELSEQGSINDYDFGILITTDEERGGYDGAKDFLDKGWSTDIVLIPEGARDWQIEQRAKGFAYSYITATDIGSHGSRPWESNNAFFKLVPALQEIKAHFKNDDPQATTVSINTVETSGAGARNVSQTPTLAKAGLDMRSFDVEDMQKSLDFIKQVAKNHGLDFELSMSDPPVILDKNNSLVKIFQNCLSEVTGKTADFVDSLGASDARHFSRQGIQSILVYPNGGGAHGAQEWLLREDLPKYYQLIKKFIEKTAKNK